MLFPSPLHPRQPKESSSPCRVVARRSRRRDLLPHLSGHRVLRKILAMWVSLLPQYRRHLHRNACIVWHVNVFMEFQLINLGSIRFLHTVWELFCSDMVLFQPMAWLHVLQDVHRGREETLVEATCQSNQVPKGSASYHNISIKQFRLLDCDICV